ncbi:MAG: hypothetical protein AB7F86_02795 [Bdellovibrionales bacterium]
MDNTKTDIKRNLKNDLEQLKTLLPELPEKALMAVHLRFWENYLIQEIAITIGLSWDETDRILEDAIKQLRDGFQVSHRQTQPKAA